jgi:hypothetical protein
MPKIATKKESNAVQTIEEVVYTGQQSRNYRKLYSFRGRKFKIAIKRDSYDFQCSAVGYLWKGEEWVNVYSIFYKNMASLKTVEVYSQTVTTVEHFRADVKTIFDQMNLIVF